MFCILSRCLIQVFALQVIEDPSKRGTFSANGEIERIDDTTLHISELPIRKWTQDYKSFLEKLLTGDGKTSEIKDFRENHTDTTVSFTVVCSKDKIDEFEKDKNGLCGKFKLSGSLTTSNMNLFNEEGRIVKFEDTREILETFYSIRLHFYEKRKDFLLEKLQIEQRKLSNKVRSRVIPYCAFKGPFLILYLLFCPGTIREGGLFGRLGSEQPETNGDPR